MNAKHHEDIALWQLEWDSPSACLIGIFSQCHIAPPMQAIFKLFSFLELESPGVSGNGGIWTNAVVLAILREDSYVNVFQEELDSYLANAASCVQVD